MSGSAVRAAVGPQLAALALVRSLVGGVLAKQGLAETLDQAEGPVRQALDYHRRWTSTADLRTEVAPVACALARTALAGLFITQDQDEAKVKDWLTTYARTVETQQAALDVEHPADSVMVSVTAVFAEELGRPEGTDWAAATRENEERATALLLEWVRPGRNDQDHFELLMSGAWFAGQMITYACAFEEDRVIGYVEGHARQLMAAGGPP